MAKSKKTEEDEEIFTAAQLDEESEAMREFMENTSFRRYSKDFMEKTREEDDNDEGEEN